MLDRMNEYIQDREFRFVVYEEKIYIVNYQKILVLEDDHVLLQSRNKKIMIQGKNLVLSKLLEKEMLLMGTITRIEVSDEEFH